eukprot:COSAG02_NODE_234_length_27784_cov_12.556872_20_plen_39_part_00
MLDPTALGSWGAFFALCWLHRNFPPEFRSVTELFAFRL